MLAMSDSDEDLLPNNVFTFQNDNTTISARGPNINNTNITGLSFQNNILTSTMHMPANFERQRYGGSNFDQRSMYCRRETSPMSLRSVHMNMPANFEQQSYGGSNFNQRSMYCRRETSPMSLRSMPDYRASTFSRLAYNSGMGSQRSMYNGRHGSPMSVRSIDTTASISAADIIFAFKNVKFNKYDLRNIKIAYNKLIKTRQRKRIEKRRNLKLFLKGARRKSGEHSGEQGSDSSMSSDDCRSVKTTICKENVPGLKQMKDLSHCSTNMRGGINHMTNVSHFTNNIRENPIFMDCTENIKLNSLRNMIPVSSSVPNFSIKDNTTTSQHQNQFTVKAQNMSVMTQKERFKKGFLLPSQRFNKTTAEQTQINNNNKKIQNLEKNIVESSKPSVNSSGSDQEEIFCGFSVNERNTQNVQRKRSLEPEDVSSLNKKRNKLNTPKKLQSLESPESTCKNIPNGKCNDFIFVKPMPIKKGNTKKDHVPEKLLAKSRVPPIAEEIDFNFEQSNEKHSEKENNKDIGDTQTDIMHTTTDTSMRPSFIKRKLFTQKLDVAEQKNVSSDSLGVNSSQNIYSASIRERNKARKLVTSQSCLSREVTGEDNNVLDLIHKIVPPDQMNNTNIANKTESKNNRSFEVKNTEKWDVTAVIANCDNQDISDTYTDEEIFNVNYEKKTEESKKSVQNSRKLPQCNVVVQKLLPQQTLNKVMKNNGSNSNKVQTKLAGKDTSKKSVTDCVKTFWDTDFESDMEFNAAPTLKNNIQQNHETVIKKRNKDLEEKKNGNSKKITTSKGTILTVRNCHQSILNTSLKSHKTSSEKKCIELDKQNLVVQEKHYTKIGKNNKETNSASHTGKKRDTVKENVPVNAKSGEVARKPKAKQCVDCVNENPTKTSKKANRDNKKDVTKNSPKNGNPRIKTPLKSKDCKNLAPKQADQDKVIKTGQKNNSRILKESIRIQPKRKSKDKSFIQSSTVKASSTRVRNKTSKAKDLVSKNTSINNTSTIITRSRDKISFDLSQCDYSSMNLSNLSNRSLRLLERVHRS